MNRIPVRSTAAMLALVLVVAARPDPGAWSAAVAGLRGAGPAPSLDLLTTLVTGAALWALAAWVLLVLAAGRLAVAPGALGAVGHRLVRASVPPGWRGLVLRGLVSGGVAGGLLLGPVAAATASTPVWPTTSTASSAVGTPGPAWPTSPAAPTTPAPATPASTTPTTPAPGTPAPGTPTPTPTAPSQTPPTMPTTSATPTPTPPTLPTTPTPPTLPTTPATPTTGAPTGVVVAPGDSLWSIAAADLRRRGAAATDAAVAAAWPSWFAVNRAVVGTDPGLLHPGTHLTAPSTPSTPNDGSTP